MPRDHRPAKSVRVLLAEDQGMMRGALALLLGMEPDLEVVAQVGRGDTIVDAALTHRPDVALLDIELPGMSGLDAAAELREQAPDCRVLILTTFGRPGYLRRAMEAGAAGFLVKDGPVEDLAAAIRRALTGETVIDPALAAAALSGRPEPADRPRVRCPQGLGGRGDGLRHRHEAPSLRVHRAQLPLVGHRQDGHPQPHGGGAGGPATGLAVALRQSDSRPRRNNAVQRNPSPNQGDPAGSARIRRTSTSSNSPNIQRSSSAV